MSRSLTINTQDRLQNKWTPSPNMSIREEDDEELQRRDTIDEEEEEEDDDEEEGSDYTSSPSIPDENINFDLVYTLHTFEATVDGQASVKKGDALTLLDDSNSYWWLIRDLKTSEVGYIPAENIETPFERLARLNKHRNVELTSLEQAAHYIHEVTQKPTKKKKVMLSTSLDVQLQILILADNEEDIEDERFEEWVEDMPAIDTDSEREVISPHSNHRSQIPDSKNNPLIEIERDNQEETVNNHAEISRAQVIPANSKIIRVFAGNVDVGASYHSIRVTETTSVNELLSNTLEKFHISEIETKHGRSYTNSGIEYYLSVETRDGDEIILDSEDNPYAIHESLTAHLTTPMPSLAQFKQFASATDNVAKKKKKRASSISYDSSVQFCLHKRIKRVMDKSGKVHIKVSLMKLPPPAEKLNTIKTTLKRFSKKTNKKDNTETERIDKLIAIPTNVLISELTSIALVKFHIIPDIHHSHQYRLILHSNGKDTLLNMDQKLSDVLYPTTEKYFILHNFSTILEERSLSKSSSTSSSSSSIMTRLDSNTEAIMKRVDAALQSFEPTSRRPSRTINIHSPQEKPNDVVPKDELASIPQYGYLEKKEALFAEKPNDLSSLADLEKELHRIISSHTS